MALVRAKRSQKKLRMAIDGPSGSGKTMTALRFAFALGKKVAVIDTENGSAAAYADEEFDGHKFEFDIETLKNYAPTEYTAAIKNIGRLGYDVLVIDGLTQAWSGSGGALEIKDSKGGNQYTAWKDVTPMHTAMIEAILTSPCHVIATMRSKVEYVLEEQLNDKGKPIQVPRKIGMAPIQRAGMEYEFDVYGSMDVDSHTLKISKTRCRAMDRQTSVMPGAQFIAPLIEWLNTGGPSAPAVIPPDEPAGRTEPTASELIFDSLMGQFRNCHEPAELSRIANVMKENVGRLTKEHKDALNAEGKRVSDRLKAAGNGKQATPTETAPTGEPKSEAAGAPAAAA